MIKAVVSDLDGMLFKEPRFFTEELEARYGIPVSESQFSKDPNYAACKRGELTLTSFLIPYYEKWKIYPQFNRSLEEITQEWFDFTKPQEEVFEIARKLKTQGITNLILTNNSRERIEYLAQKYDLASLFEIIGSYDLNALKPDPKFFEELKTRHNLLPNEVLYFDDKEATIEALKQYGFQAVRYHAPEDLVSALQRAGILD